MSERVELLYKKPCPNVEGARAALQETFRRVGRAPKWRELERAAMRLRFPLTVIATSFLSVMPAYAQS